MIDWSKISDNVEVVELVKQIELLSEKVISLDEMALVRYQLEILNIQEELKKTNVCVYIENEAQLQEARELLEKYNEPIFEMFFNLKISTHLMCDVDDFDWYVSQGDSIECRTQITLQQLEAILNSEP